jgi:hypothetical protein
LIRWCDLCITNLLSPSWCCARVGNVAPVAASSRRKMRSNRTMGIDVDARPPCTAAPGSGHAELQPPLHKLVRSLAHAPARFPTQSRWPRSLRVMVAHSVTLRTPRDVTRPACRHPVAGCQTWDRKQRHPRASSNNSREKGASLMVVRSDWEIWRLTRNACMVHG